MKRQIYLGIVLQVIAQVIIGGWAFMQMLKPENVMEVLQAFTMC